MKQLPLPILLKYDEDDLIVHLKQFLNKMSFNTVSFTDPLLAFEHLKYSHRNYSLILKDLWMPNISEIELAIKIRKDLDSSINIFFITAFDISDLNDNWIFNQQKWRESF